MISSYILVMPLTMQPVFAPCADKQIALNIEKCHFFQSTVTFVGFQLSSNGYQVDKSISDAIASFLTPNNHTDLCSFFGLANQLSASTNTST